MSKAKNKKKAIKSDVHFTPRIVSREVGDFAWSLSSLTRWWFIYLFILLPVRAIFGMLLPPFLHYVWHNGSFLHLAQDDEPVYARVRLVASKERYGLLARETFDVLIPDACKENLGREGKHWRDWIDLIATTVFDILTCYPRALLAWWLPKYFAFSNANLSLARNFPAILFVHGGGYTAIDPAIQHHQCTAFARKGFAVYCMAYPWAPENAHPQQLVSALRMLQWMKVTHGHQSVAIVGESAGGNLVTVLAALLSNPCALTHFSHLADKVYCMPAVEHLAKWTYPQVHSVCSWYGILDRHSWKGKGFLAWGLQWTVDAHRGMVPISFGRKDTEIKAGHECDFLTITDAIQAGWVQRYPRVLLIAGTTDPLGLVHSSRTARDVLKLVPNIDGIEYLEYEAGHAFIGLNPFILVALHGEKWRSELALPATMKTIDFLVRGYEKVRVKTSELRVRIHL